MRQPSESYLAKIFINSSGCGCEYAEGDYYVEEILKLGWEWVVDDQWELIYAMKDFPLDKFTHTEITEEMKNVYDKLESLDIPVAMKKLYYRYPGQRTLGLHGSGEGLH